MRIWACGSYKFSFVGVISICVDMVDRRAEVVGRLKALEEAAAPLVAFLQNPNAVQELRSDKQYNLQMLSERYQV
jgi:translation initiation factor 3 subunit E